MQNRAIKHHSFISSSVLYNNSRCCFFRPKLAVEADAQLEGALAAEVSLTVVDVLEGVVSVVQQTDTLQPVLAHVLRVLLHCLAVNQSATVLTHMLATQRAIVSKVTLLLSYIHPSIH